MRRTDRWRWHRRNDETPTTPHWLEPVRVEQVLFDPDLRTAAELIAPVVQSPAVEAPQRHAA